MTREEAIKKLEVFEPMVVDDTREAIDVAIETLQATEHDGCEGCKYTHKDQYEMPCLMCKQSKKDLWERKEP